MKIIIKITTVMYLLHVQEAIGGGWVGWLDPKLKMHGRPVVYRRDTAKPSWDPRKGNHGNTSDFFRYSSVRPISSVCLSVTAKEQLALL